MRHLLLVAGLTTLSLSSVAEEFTIAAFNAEFLLTDKVHIKYGLRFDMSDNTQTATPAETLRELTHRLALERTNLC